MKALPAILLGTVLIAGAANAQDSERLTMTGYCSGFFTPGGPTSALLEQGGLSTVEGARLVGLASSQGRQQRTAAPPALADAFDQAVRRGRADADRATPASAKRWYTTCNGLLAPPSR